MCKYVIIFTFFLSSSIIQAQERYTISGYVRDASTGEELINANVYIEELETGTTTNEYGFYSVTIPADNYTITYSYIGYELQEVKLHLDRNMRQSTELSERIIALKDLDEAPVYTASHLLGFFSGFNSDAIRDVKLRRSGDYVGQKEE